ISVTAPELHRRFERARQRVFPVGEERPKRRDESERLIQNQMVMRSRDLDYRRVSTEELVHVLAGLRRDDVAMLAAEERDATAHVREVLVHRLGSSEHEHLRIELPRVATFYCPQRFFGDEIEDEPVLAGLRRNESEVFLRRRDVRIRFRIAERTPALA